MCAQCYMKQYDRSRSNERRRKDPSDYSPNYRKPPSKPKRNAECHPDRAHVALGLCRSCYEKDRQGRSKAECHPDKPAVAKGKCASCYSKRWYEQNPEAARRHARESHKRMRENLRTELIAAYGGRCACRNCPETNTAFLTLDHINGDGKAHRLQVGSHTYADLRRKGFPRDGYRLLCWNCNAMTRNGQVCPHEGGS